MISLRAEYRPMGGCGYAAQYLGEAPERYVVESDGPPRFFTSYHAALRAFLASAGRDA